MDNFQKMKLSVALCVSKTERIKMRLIKLG